MNDPAIRKIDVDTLTTRIRQEVARRRLAAHSAALRPGADSRPIPSDAEIEPVCTEANEISRLGGPSDEGRTRAVASGTVAETDTTLSATPGRSRISRLDDFAQFYDAALVEAAYLTVLNRTPDPTGEEFYLELLRKGASKAEVLGRLRYSAEGRACSVKIAGLARAYFLDKVARYRIVGWLFRTLSSLWDLPNTERRMRTIVNQVARVAAQTDERFRMMQEATHAALSNIETRIGLLANELATRATREEISLIRRSITELRQLSEAFDQTKATLAQIESLRAEVAASKVTQQTRPTSEQFGQLAARFVELDLAVTGLRGSKADASEVDRVRTEARTSVHRGIDDVNRTFRMLLESKADQVALENARRELDAVFESGIAKAIQTLNKIDAKKADAATVEALRAEARVALEDGQNRFEAALESRLASVMQAVRSIDAKKLDATRLEPIRDEIGATLRDLETGLEAAFESKLAAVMQALGSIDAKKPDATRLEAIREEFEAALRGGKSDMEAALESRLASVMQAVRLIESQKLDSTSEHAIREQYQAAVRTGLEGLTAAVAALAATKVDREVVNALLLEYSQGQLEQTKAAQMSLGGAKETSAKTKRPTRISNHKRRRATQKSA